MDQTLFQKLLKGTAAHTSYAHTTMTKQLNLLTSPQIIEGGIHFVNGWDQHIQLDTSCFCCFLASFTFLCTYYETAKLRKVALPILQVHL